MRADRAKPSAPPWTLTGLWELILEAFNESKAVPDTVQMIDTTTLRG